MSKIPVLFSCPAHDDVTAYLHVYATNLADFANSKGFQCLFREKEHANKEEVTRIIEKKNPAFVMFNGHGDSECICGHDNEVIVKTGDNEHLLESRITYALSCSSALELGKRVSEKEKTTFIGYTDDFALGMDTNYQTTPHLDERAKLFLEPSNTLVKALIKGNTAKEAVSRSKRQILKNISLLKTDPAPEAADYLPYLFYNYLSLVAQGDISASLE